MPFPKEVEDELNRLYDKHTQKIDQFCESNKIRYISYEQYQNLATELLEMGFFYGIDKGRKEDVNEYDS